MAIFDWLQPRHPHRPTPASPAGRSSPGWRRACRPKDTREEPDRENGVDEGGAETFFVAAFPFYDGPVLLPILRTGSKFDLVPEPSHPFDPNAVRIQRGRDHLGDVPAPLNEQIHGRRTERVPLTCWGWMLPPI
jgi:hypothetical protein